ncbi:MAG TPA: PKD domain-containing protein [Thermoanaerobaculia bacterium]|nr:PKD domain-containing protein [Thermoanaerobaculia bacterium]
MRRTVLSILAVLGLLAGACDSGNPVAPKAPETPGTGSSDLVVVVTSDRGTLEAGSVQGATLTVSARNKDGSIAADGTEVVLNTSLGTFGTDASGKPVQLVKKPLAGGATTVQLFPGAAPGTANVLAQVGVSVGRLNLPIVGPSAPPVAEFTFQVSGLSVLFADASTGNPTSWQWDFGDGESVGGRTSTQHTYPQAGTYTVTLTVAAANGASSTVRKFVTVVAGLPLQAAFGFEVNGLTVLFSDISTGEPVSWIWEFGDGGTSSERNPSHTYARPANYAVKLTILNEFGISATASKFVSPTLGEAPKAEFDFQADGLRVLFTDRSEGNPDAWTWDFGDGTSSTAQSPEHTYGQPGTFNVTLTARNEAGSTGKSKFVAVSRGEPPKAAFEFQANGLNVVFIDRSEGAPTSWTWEFGDCSGPLCESTQQNPTHTYASPGSYTVILTAANAAGTSRATELVTVSTAGPPVADFCYQRNGLTVIFTDTSTSNPASWQWDFGDCAEQGSTCKSTSQNPGHAYLTAKTYAVTLTVVNAAGQSSESKFVIVHEDTSDGGPVCP